MSRTKEEKVRGVPAREMPPPSLALCKRSAPLTFRSRPPKSNYHHMTTTAHSISPSSQSQATTGNNIATA